MVIDISTTEETLVIDISTIEETLVIDISTTEEILIINIQVLFRHNFPTNRSVSIKFIFCVIKFPPPA